MRKGSRRPKTSDETVERVRKKILQRTSLGTTILGLCSSPHAFFVEAAIAVVVIIVK